VLALVGDSEGCTLWRVWQPFTELQRRGYAAWWRYKDDAELGAPEWPYLAATRLEAVILPRLSWRDQTDARRFVDSVHDAGLAVIYDLDDDLLSPQIRDRLHTTTQRERSCEKLEQDRRDRIAAVRLCDGVTTSNEYLAELHRLLWPDVFILGGAVSERFGEFAPLLRSAAEIRPASFANQAGVVGAALAAATPGVGP